ncbi:hypothetical protein PO909_028686, partial [Leuciscus waleckii]
SQAEFSAAAVLHQARRDQVADTCRAHSASSRKRRVLTPSDLKHLVVDEEHELIYCYVPKVACTNWKRVMMVLSSRGKYSDPMEIPSNEAHIPSNLKTLNQYSIPDINHRLKNYLKFLFVREPFERLVSAYRNKFTLRYNTSFHKRYGTKIVRRYRKNATAEALQSGADVKFQEFADYLVDPGTQREAPLNEHWQTVYSLCHPCHIHYDLVGKYETLEEDANYVLKLAGSGWTLVGHGSDPRTVNGKNTNQVNFQINALPGERAHTVSLSLFLSCFLNKAETEPLSGQFVTVSVST